MGNCPVRVLQVQIGGKTFSGVASYLYQYYKNMDHTLVHYDFLFCRENSMELVKDDPILKDSRFYVLNAIKGKSNDYFAIHRRLKRILRDEHYDAVVVNTSILAVIYVCMLATKGIKNTKLIAHAHNTDLVLGKDSLRAKLLFLSNTLDALMRRWVRMNADYLFACTEAAAEMTFGKEAVKMEKFKLVKNAIDTAAFEFNAETRNKVRNHLNTAENAQVYGNIGSFCKRKNQIFLIKVFNLIHKRIPDSELWLIGDGNDRGMIETLVNDLNLQSAIRLLGQRSDVNELMQAMDYFVFPTLSEGLGIVAIESQASGLPTVVSDGVPKDVLITDLAVMLELEKGEHFWAEKIMTISTPAKREEYHKTIAKEGFDIQEESKKLTFFFADLV